MFLPHRNEVFIMYQALFIKTLRLSRHCVYQDTAAAIHRNPNGGFAFSVAAVSTNGFCADDSDAKVIASQFLRGLFKAKLTIAPAIYSLRRRFIRCHGNDRELQLRRMVAWGMPAPPLLGEMGGS